MPEVKAQPTPDTGDTLDRFMAEWSAERPDLDFDYLATVGRILRVSAHLRDNMDSWLAPFGLTWEMFDLLASLQRSGGKTGLRPTDLYEACMLSSGAMTNRVDRAEKLGYAVRQPDPDDGRATRIALTKRGRGLTEKAMTEHATRAGEISHRLTAKEQAQLAGLLRKMLLSLEEAPVAAPRKSSANGRRAALA
ncbi:MAG: MarR family transcriptional regulator [Pseudolabrys sp.]|nr:MarR family transcriptional regulator [Pseudolabrys sp.]MDP2293924.1 MarR family transcriptional regulator [Pseudolabrys sp.]